MRTLLSSPLVLIVALLVLAAVLAGISVFILRSGGKAKKRAAAADSSGAADWQRQGQGGQGAASAWGQPQPGVGNPGDNPWGQQSAQPGGWSAQQPQPGGWGAQSPAQAAQQPGGWGAQPAGQPSQPAGWGAQNPAQAAQQPGGWGAQSPDQQPQPGGWGAQNPAQQPQPAAWGNPGAQPASANIANASPWDAPQPAASQDPWAQPQQANSPWGAQGGSPSTQQPQSQQQPPPAFGTPNSAPSWGQQPQQAAAADPWAQPQQQQPAAQQSPWSQNQGFQAPNQAGMAGLAPNAAAGGNAGAPAWQQPGPQGFGGPGPGMPQEPTVSPFAPDVDKTMLRSTGQQGRIGIVRVEEGKEPGRIYEARKESLSIGRSRESDIFLEDLAVSRLHASILNQGNGNYALKDEGSANGTKVNGQLVNKYQTYPLQEGDKIQLGQTVLVFAKR